MSPSRPHGLVRRAENEVHDTRPKLRPAFSLLFKILGAAVFLFAVAALFWQWALFAAFGALVALAAVWLVAVYQRKQGPEDVPSAGGRLSPSRLFPSR